MNLLANADRLFTKAEKRADKWKKLYKMQEIPEDTIDQLYEDRLKEEWDIEKNRLKDKIIPAYFELKDILEEFKVIVRDNTEKLPERYVFITLRPEPDACLLKTFMYHCETFFKKNLFINSEWVFEQAGKTELEQGNGFHCHGIAMVKNYVAVKDIIRAYEFIPYNCILQIGRKDSKTKFITKQQDLDYARNYIRGDKFNAEKEKAVIIDKIWREKNQISAIYT